MLDKPMPDKLMPRDRFERGRLVMNDMKTERYATFTDWLRARAKVLTEPLARLLARLGLHPNTITLVGVLLSAASAAVLASGYIRLGGGLLLLTSSVDALDGTLARLTGRKSRFGAFLDSSLDRISDALLLFGLLVYLLSQGDAYLEIYLVFISLVGFIMVSYTRARAEGVGYECKTGILTRVERILVLGVGLLTGFVLPTLIVLAVGSWITVLQRILYVYRESRTTP
jgi:CDP-diacylglycerol--glycerol-3-phosphate 3-phosphatidyltransferase